MSMGAFKAAVVGYMYILYKFGGLLSSTSAVTVAQLCTADIDQHSRVIHLFTRGSTFVSLLLARGRHCYAWLAVYTGLCHEFLVYYIIVHRVQTSLQIKCKIKRLKPNTQKNLVYTD